MLILWTLVKGSSLTSRRLLPSKLAIFLLVVYQMILIGNLIILTLVATDPKLQSAMYIFLSHLSLVDIVISTNKCPR
uniref:G-protein coupled receptors family 1 profile domain-containing protein n=1 Tax=Salmo trutta TaxID=8032 RepID=A0A673XVG0_SALTR